MNRFLQMSKGCEDTCVHINARQMVTSAEEEFNNQVDRMTTSVNSQPLSPAIAAINQWAHEQSVHDS